MKGRILLKKIEIRSFTPMTTAGDYVERKKSLRNEILRNIHNIEELRKNAIGKKLFLDVCFYLNDKTGMEGDTQKDIDNLLPVVFDVLPEHFSDERNQLIDGIGLMKKKSDHMVFEVHSIKQFVSEHEDEGMDIEIYEWREKTGFIYKLKSFFD